MSEVNQTPQAQDDRVDSNGLLYIFRLLRDVFVGKENGKGLSTEDYTTAEKTKLGNMQEIAGVQRNGTDLTPDVSTKKVNVEVPVLGVQRNGVDVTPDNGTKKANIIVPVLGVQVDGVDVTPNPSTMKVNIDMSAKAPIDSPMFTGIPQITTTPVTSDNTHKVADTAFVKAAIAAALSGKIDLQFDFSYASKAELPATGVVGTFYFIPAVNSETGTDEYEEYVWNSALSQYERVGAAKVDLSSYYNTTNLPAITNAQIDTLLASSATPAQSGS